jgi:hypothetical protein
MPKITKSCQICGKEFVTYRDRDNSCSKECARLHKNNHEKARRERKKQELGKVSYCVYCGKQTEIKNYNQLVSCSLEHSMLYRIERKKLLEKESRLKNITRLKQSLEAINYMLGLRIEDKQSDKIFSQYAVEYLLNIKERYELKLNIL